MLHHILTTDDGVGFCAHAEAVLQLTTHEIQNLPLVRPQNPSLSKDYEAHVPEWFAVDP